MSTQVIEFDDPNDKTTGYLSCISNHGFSLDGKWWPTVMHYVHAKKFDGSMFENIIRRAETPWRLKILLKPKIIEGQKVYGLEKDQCFHMRTDWKQVEKQVMFDAILAKFTQHKSIRKKLIETDNALLKCKSDPKIGKVLEQVRKELTTEKKQIKKEVNYFEKDFDLDENYQSVFFHCISILCYMAMIECQTKIHPQMMEDFVFNFGFHAAYLDEINQILFAKKTDWTNIYKTMPNVSKMTSKIQKILVFKRKVDENNIEVSVMIVLFLKWVSEIPEEISSAVLEKLTYLHEHRDEISFMKKHRPYRNHLTLIPKVEVFRTRKKVKVLGYLSPFKKRLEELGGERKSSTKMIFCPTSFDIVQDAIFSMSTHEQKIQQIFRDWFSSRFILLIDTCILLQFENKNKVITPEIVDQCFSMLSLDPKKRRVEFEYDFFEFLFMCEQKFSFSMTKDAKEKFFCLFVELYEILLSCLIKKSLLDEIVFRLNSYFGYVPTHVPNDGYTKIEHFIASNFAKLSELFPKDTDKIWLHLFNFFVDPTERQKFRVSFENSSKQVDVRDLLEQYVSDVSEKMATSFSIGLSCLKNYLTLGTSRIMFFSIMKKTTDTPSIKKRKLYQASSNWIAVMADSTAKSIPSNDPITDEVYEKFPYANIYLKNLQMYTPGTIIISKSESNPKIIVSFIVYHPQADSLENRRKWFASCLTHLRQKGIYEICFSSAQIKDYLDILKRSKEIKYSLV